MLLKNLMGDFLMESPEELQQFLPLEDEQVESFPVWSEVESPRRLIRDYSFPSRDSMFLFVSGLVQFENITGHNAKIVIDNKQVRVEVYTHDVDDITELDVEYAQYADALFADVGGA